MNKRIILLGFFALQIASTWAQKQPLNHTVYDNWQSITANEISRTGTYIYFQILPQEGDGKLYVKNNLNKDLFSLPRGYNASLTNDETNLVSLIKPKFEDTRQAKIKKKKPEDMPKDSIAVFSIVTGKLSKFSDVKSYKLAEEGNRYFGFLTDGKIEVRTKTDTTASQTKKTVKGATLHVFDFATGDTLNFQYVDQYDFNKAGNMLVFSKKVDAKDSISHISGVFLYDFTKKSLKKITNGRGDYKNFTFDDSGQQLVYLGDRSSEKSLLKDFNIYYYTTKQDSSRIVVRQQTAGVPKNWYVSGDGDLKFSKNGEKLFLGLAPIPPVKDTTLVDFEHAKVDVWHWQDDYLQPQQLINLKKDLAQSFLSVYYPKQNSPIIPLVDDKFNPVRTTLEADQEYVLATSDYGKRIETQWDYRSRQDVYVISTISGARQLVIENLSGQSFLTPDGRYVVYFNQENGNWYSYQIDLRKTTTLNDGLPVSFVDEDNDMPAKPNGYGMAAWAVDNKGIYIYDKYDIWYFALDGSDHYMVTNGYGRVSRIVLRYQNLLHAKDKRKETNILDQRQRVILTAFNEKTKENGFYELKGKHNDPKVIVMAPKAFKNLQASGDQKYVLYTKEDYANSPDLYLNDNAFKKEDRLTNLNPQQANYNWGTAELVKWTTPAGHAAEGILYKPEDFDPNKKYPIIAYFYEKLTDGLYNYQAPAPTPSRLNISYFVSNGYLVFAPDISYVTGQPGKSAEEYINSGMQYLAQNTWVDAKKMGIQGQSWGGYQVAYLITATNMYAAAWAGAPVVNMTSAYGGIRWQTGMSRQFQYENTQSRIGKTLWEDRDAYLANSPLFHLDKVTTPVVIMSNDNDGAVPWYQGIEMFTALRRLQKPVWMLNYNGDEHNLMLRQNRKDIQIREQQFFDHYLKGSAAPKWLKSGVLAKEKGVDWGFSTE
ncbi:prolyl oligopeptidase family serine peptidase [Sphingobacterium sp. SRCM116780]|uniref:S9 family peptidase n=1 Tax=Sphingobacterium sp. SRCM116780 TaxID=2907623 RepID=UPI001F1FCC8C|nr:prolyl oligopeptidase family serine peptidase [Sphingobacterium sp. SRCM116780]UIR56952.1 prolyl oligopeptidase family serine peptidase [Sphingobacterium sp. SRCM116780]